MNNLINQKFGRLEVIEQIGIDKWGCYRWLCLCDCGREKIIRSTSLKNGYTKSCGCLRIKHGYASNKKRSKIYRIWKSMRQRCTNPNNKRYKNYGDRGITVCERWNKFENFLEDMGLRPDNLQIDRIDNNKGYSKDNCRWATRSQQARNRRSNHIESYNGKIQTLIEWAEEYNINPRTLCQRLYKYGWSIEKALITPVRKKRKK